MEGEVGAGVAPPNTIFCLFCRATIAFPGLPANRYLQHLFAEHNIMHEVQSVINRTLALQLPKEYPELVDGTTLPDSSTRLTSPAPSSEGASPAPNGCSLRGTDCGTQTEALVTTSIAIQADFAIVEVKVDKVEKKELKEEVEEGDEEAAAMAELAPEVPPVVVGVPEKGKRGCPKGGWPNKKNKKKKKDGSITARIRKILETAISNKKDKYDCEICQAPFKKIYKLKLHLMKDHNNDILTYNQAAKKPEPKAAAPVKEKIEIPPERKSLRIGHVEGDEVVERPPAPAHLIRNEAESWTEGSEYFCMLCSQSFTAFGIYKHHIGDTHGLLIEDYRAKFGKVGEVINKYNCKLCQEDIIHKYTNIKHHLKSIHDISVADYTTKYHNANPEPEREVESMEAEAEAEAEAKAEAEAQTEVPECNEAQSLEIESTAAEEDDLPLEHQTVDDHQIVEVHSIEEEMEEEEEEEVQVITSMTAPQPDEVVMMDEEVSETGSDVGKKRWYEGCSYTCLACNKAYDIYFSYHGHIKKIHNMSMEQYHTTYGQEGEVNRYYSCKLCHTNVVWRLFNIRKHMESTHELTLDQYGQMYEGVNAMDPKPAKRARMESHMESNQPSQGLTQNHQMEKMWYEGEDQYQCLICSAKIAHKYNNIASHMTLIHDLSMAEYEKEMVARDQTFPTHFLVQEEEEDNEVGAEEEEEEEEEHQFTEADIIIENPEEEEEEESIDDTEENMLVINEDGTSDYQTETEQVDPMKALQEQAQNPCQEMPASIPITPVSLPPPPPLRAAPGALAARKAAEVGAESPTPSYSPSPTPPTLQQSSKSSLKFDSRPESQWYHGSDLTCEICHKSFVDFTYYCTHIRTIHQISKEQYNERYGTGNERFRLYRCLVCGISVKWTYQSICGHLKSHEISIKDYETNYKVLDNQNTESGKISDLTMNADVVLEQHGHKKARFNEQGGFSSLLNHLNNPPHLQARAQQMFKQKPERIQADLSSPTGKWYNQCKFTCKACPEEKYFTVPQALRMHLNGIHSMSRKDYEARYGTAETVTRYWTCLICNKELKCQKGIIIQHLLNVHAMELVDYERQYMDAGDQVVARETRRPRKNKMLNKLAMQALAMNTMNMNAMNAMNAMNIAMNMPNSQEANESYNDPGDLSQFLVQRMDEGPDQLSIAEGEGSNDISNEGPAQLSIEGPAVTSEVSEEPQEITSMSKLVVEGMDHVPWYFGCRYSCQICNKVWHYPQAARYHLDSVHKLTRAQYEAQYGTCEVETRIFHCSICQRSMKCERDIIKYHLEAKHSMSLEEYVDQCPVPVVTVGESRRSNAATHARGNIQQAMPLLQRFPGFPPMLKQEVAQTMPMPLIQEKGAPWYRGSNFTCIPCQRQFTAQVSYISHINSKHGMNLREYREQYGSVEEIRQYQCKVPGCTRYVSWTYSGINDHLKSHSLSMQQYEATYLGIGVGQTAPLPAMPTLEAPKNIKMETEDFATVVEKWSNGPGKECVLCQNKVPGGPVQFTTHLLERHQVTLTEYSTQYPEDGPEKHSCRVCHENIEFGNQLKEHMKTHGITIEHYYHKFIGSTNKDATNAELIISKVTKSPPILKMAITGMANGTSNGVSNSAPIKVRKNHWANGCSYQCIMCKGQQYPEEFMFKKHILTAHNMSTEEYQNNFGDPALVKQLHICKVCNKDVKHEYTAILNHLRVKHNMTLTAYTQTYIRPVGTAPPTEPVIVSSSSLSPPMMSKPQLPTSTTSTTTTLNLPLAEMPAANEETDQFYIVYPEQEQK